MVNTKIRPITIDDYHQMIAYGIIHEGERIELIAGQMFNMAAKGTRHTFSTTRLLRELSRLIAQQAIIRCQEPITLPNNSEPEPDLVIARLRADDYIESHPAPEDILLVIEVADSTLDFDRNTKAPLYATARIGEYWIINLIDNRLEIYQQPEEAIYTSAHIVLPPRSIDLPQFPDITLDLAAIFPPKK